MQIVQKMIQMVMKILKKITRNDKDSYELFNLNVNFSEADGGAHNPPPYYGQQKSHSWKKNFCS